MNRFLYFALLFIILFLPGCSAEDYNPIWKYNPSWASFARLSKRLANQHHMRLIGSGTGVLVDGEKVRWAFSVVDGRKLTLEEAKILAADLLKDVFKSVMSDPLYEAYFKKLNKEEPGHPSQTSREYFGFRVAFWDKNMDRPLAPYVAQIRAVDGRVEFYYADPETQALQTPAALTISYEDLLSQN